MALKVLYTTNMYPTAEKPWYGIFVKEQIEAIKRYYPELDFDVYYVNGRKGYGEYLKSMFAINKMIRRGDYDLVHAHYGLAGLFTLMPFRRKIPTVLTLHGGDIQIAQNKYVQVFLTKHILKRCNVAVTLNDSMQGIVELYNSHALQIPCSVNTTVFYPGSEREPLKGKKNLTILFPSDRSRTVKNYPLFSATVELLRRQHGLEIDTVELSGMSRTEIADHMRSADMMLMTSVSEGSPQTVKEAMACNLPVVSTKVGDVDRLLLGVRDSGWVDEHTPDALAAKILSVLRGEVAGKAPRERLLELKLDDESTARAILDIYKSLHNNSMIH